MFHSIHISGFRGLQDFSMEKLGRINLLVGTNNSGKSSILEGIELLASRGSPLTIWDATHRRGERFLVEEDGRAYPEVDVSHLFYGHELKKGSLISVSAVSDIGHENFVLDVTNKTPSQQSSLHDSSSIQLLDDLELRISWHNVKGYSSVKIPISPRIGLDRRILSRQSSEMPDARAIQFVSTSAMSIDRVRTLFDEVVLSPEEDLLVEALRTIEPTIERIAAIGSEGSRSHPGGIVLKLHGFPNRIPLGSMGDGIWRILGIALSLVNAENGIVLIDEIDTGLHYTVLSKMWQLIQQTANRLNIQVFATTHSRDCYESLATIAREDVSEDSCVTIQRIESDSSVATVFTEQEIVAASERGIEVR